MVKKWLECGCAVVVCVWLCSRTDAQSLPFIPTPPYVLSSHRVEIACPLVRTLLWVTEFNLPHTIKHTNPKVHSRRSNRTSGETLPGRHTCYYAVPMSLLGMQLLRSLQKPHGLLLVVSAGPSGEQQPLRTHPQVRSAARQRAQARVSWLGRARGCRPCACPAR